MKRLAGLHLLSKINKEEADPSLLPAMIKQHP